MSTELFMVLFLLCIGSMLLISAYVDKHERP